MNALYCLYSSVEILISRSYGLELEWKEDMAGICQVRVALVLNVVENRLEIL